MIYIIDTSAWIEYLIGSNKGKILTNLFKSAANKFITVECSLAELTGYSLREKIDFRRIYGMIRQNSIILPVLTEHWLEAGKIKTQLRGKLQGFGLIDALLVAKQKELNCKLISADSHFNSLKDVVYLE